MINIYFDDQVLSNWWHTDPMLSLIRPSNRSFLNIHEHFVPVFIIKWWNTNNHFIYQYAQSPPIKSMIMPCTHNHLRCYKHLIPISKILTQILRCPTEWIRLSCQFSQAKISKSNVSSLIHQYILWFEISVQDLTLMQVSQSQSNLSCIEASPFLWEPSFLS